MATLAELTRLDTGLSKDQLRHLQRLIAWWGILADLSFSDLLLFVPIEKAVSYTHLTLPTILRV